MTLSIGEARSWIAGLERQTPLLGGGARRYVNLDNAATTPPFRQALEAVHGFADWYASVHRGSGFKSSLSTELYGRCRRTVAEFVGADPDYHAAIFCSNTTDAINKLCGIYRLAPGERFLTTVMEHHSNMLPWRLAGPVDYVSIRRTDGALDIECLERKLREHQGRIRLVSVTGASNVTGTIPPLQEIARLAHRHGAQLLVDAAQLVAHRPIRMGSGADPERIDFLAFSAHKMYAPFGSGALIGPKEFFESQTPSVVGGGAVDVVTLNRVEWSLIPDRMEAGTPNLIGALALARAIQALDELGMENVARHERELTAKALRRLARVAGVKVYGDQDPELKRDRVGVIPLMSEKIHHALLAAVLGYEWGIGVRHGCFCAHPYVIDLLALKDEEVFRYIEEVRNGDRSKRPGFVRVSLGLYNTEEEIEYLAGALEHILAHGPRGRYAVDPSTGDRIPEGFSFDLDSHFPLFAPRRPAPPRLERNAERVGLAPRV